MTTPHLPKVAGINPPLPAPSHTPPPSSAAPSGDPATVDPSGPADPADPHGPAAPDALPPPAPNALVQDRLAGWISDLVTLQELTERLARTATLDAALHEVLRAGSSLVGARRGLVTLQPGQAPPTTVGLGLGHADLGHIETIPHETPAHPDGGELPAPDSYGRLFDDLPPAGSRVGVAHPDIAAEEGLTPRHREVAARLGYGASYALPLESEAAGRIGAAVWLYDEPAEPGDRQRHLIGLYRDYATEHLARHLELAAARDTVTTLREELLPSRLPRIAGVRLAVRHRSGPRGGGDWYDALPLPEGALGLAVGGVTGSGPSAVAAMGRLRASLRAYAVMEGEDPVAVLSDLELLLRLTEPARAATALFAYCEPAGADRPASQGGKVVLAGAGHCPPLIIGEHRAEYVETSLSAPLGMLACWEAPSVEIEPAPGETLLFYSDGLLHRTGDTMDRAFARLHSAAASVPRAALRDPDAIVEHVLRAMLPTTGDGAEADGSDGAEDVVLLAAHFE
ncbi:PP2C family protein-serine/threonine phosphatase [Streptomyces sp. NPDC020799]|uniref:PP2C family protein-serine/threonine phosphatase n=1 Tax=Streptomyces sp. NPDC020799 TaxID=3365091 RepID=UPI0037B66CDF